MGCDDPKILPAGQEKYGQWSDGFHCIVNQVICVGLLALRLSFFSLAWLAALTPSLVVPPIAEAREIFV